MSTAVATPAASDFTSARGMMDSILESSPVTEVIEQQAPPKNPDAPEETAAPESEVEEDAELAEDETPPADDDEEDEDLDSIKDGKKYRVNPTKMRRLLKASEVFKAAQDLFEPTADAVKQHYEAATSFGHMTADFKSAEPANISEFMRHWSTESPEGFAQLARSLPAFLAQGGHVAPLQAIEAQVANALVQRNYNEVAQIAATPEKDRSAADKAKLYRAQTLDYSLNGKYKKEEEIQEMANRQKQATPSIDRRAQEVEAREKSIFDREWNNFDSQYVTGAKESALNESLDAGFKPFEGKFSDRILKSLKRDAREEVQAAIDKRSEWKRNQSIAESDIQREFRQALKTNSRTNLGPKVDPLVSEYRQFINRVIPGIVKTLTPGATKAVVDENKAEHDKLARSARQTAPSAGGAPTSRVLKGQHKDVTSALNALFG